MKDKFKFSTHDAAEYGNNDGLKKLLMRKFSAGE